MNNNYIFTSESVTEGHPDKVADQISDAVLDAMIKQDPHSRVACETLIKTGMTIIAGEVTTNTWVSLPEIVRKTIKSIGYTSSDMGFDSDTCAVLSAIEPQSPDIAQGVDQGRGLYKKQGAGDQGMMFGYASNETKALMPAPILYAHQLCSRLAEVRKNDILSFIRPDGKSQVTMKYENGKPTSIETIVISTQHTPSVKYADLKEAIIEEVILKTIPKSLLSQKVKMLINPTGRFVKGGPEADAGLTGRKIIVDTYGGMARHGGGAFSGKDPSKVDRSAAYYARYMAKNIVAAGLAEKCEVQLAYAIGVAAPVSILIETFGTEKVNTNVIHKLVKKHFNAEPSNIIEELDLLRPIYQKTAAYGHFGRSGSTFTWENTKKAKTLSADAGIKKK